MLRTAALSLLFLHAAHLPADEVNAKQCFDSYYGASSARDMVGARRCFIAEVPKHECTEPFDLDRLYLAVMYLDAQGGPADFPAARALIAGCQGQRKEGVEKAIDARVTGAVLLPQGPSELDYCKSIATTTTDSESCANMHALIVGVNIDTAEKSLLTTLDAEEQKLYTAWKTAWNNFAKAQAEWVADRNRGGTGRGAALANTLNEMNREHLDDMQNLISVYRDPKDDAAALAESQRKLDDQYRQRLALADAQNRELLQKAQSAWTEYEKSAPPFYCRILPLQDCGPLTTDLLTRLNDYRLKELTYEPKGSGK
jgi:uncharacterized protein YecT (DUF1311 family)